MAQLVWDRVGERTFESGLDRGVLYLPDGSAVPWNGLTDIIEKFDKDSSPVYYDGMKINELVTLGSFSATLRAITYPDEFTEFEGSAPLRRGVLFNDQPPQLFCLCYRTKVGDDVKGQDANYKLHIIYNLIAVPTDKSYSSISDDPSLVEFEWDISAIPEEVPGFAPTAHITLDSRNFDPFLLEDIEHILYGSVKGPAMLLSMQDFVTFINEWYRVKIIDNGDGTWTAVSDRPGFIQFMTAAEDFFQIVNVNAVYLDDDTYEISDTADVTDVPSVIIYDNGDGTWTAKTDHPSLIVMTGPGEFEIRNVNATFMGDGAYRVSTTIDD